MKWDAIGMGMLAFAVFGSLAVDTYVDQKAKTEIAVSCNNLKAAALAASQPEPTCAK
jgi:hypothetical protein